MCFVKVVHLQLSRAITANALLEDGDPSMSNKMDATASRLTNAAIMDANLSMSKLAGQMVEKVKLVLNERK